MRYRLLALPLLALITIGCGGDEKSAPAPLVPEATPTPVVTYDLKDYLIPSATQTNKYSVTNYKNTNQGAYTLGKIESYDDSYTLLDSNSTRMIRGSVDKYKYIVDSKNIVKEDFGTGSTIESVERNVTIGKVLSDINGTKCTVSEYINSKVINTDTTYTDLLNKQCKSATNNIPAGLSYYNETIVEDTLYAKSKGIVSITKVTCNYTPDTNTSRCDKVETILTGIEQ